MEKKEMTTDNQKKRRREIKSDGFYMRMTPSETSLLEILSYACDESKTDVMRKALMQYYELNKHKL